MMRRAERGLQSLEDSEAAVGGQRLSLAFVINGLVALRLSSLHFLQDVVQICGQHVEERQHGCGEIFFPAVNLAWKLVEKWSRQPGSKRAAWYLRYLRWAEKEKQTWWVQIYWVITHRRETESESEREQTAVLGVAACNDWVAPLAEVEVGPADINLKPIPASDSVCRRPIQLLAF